ncbi:MAG TPA: CBS domain-containing protein [Terriglobales bacterium]|nr:CBS domain-containing protein [Terriglobales bacterium]
MSVLHLCGETPATVSPEASVADAIRTMLERRVGAVAVVNPDKTVAGIFTERDVLRKLALGGINPESSAVVGYMTRDVVTATPETTPGEALATMVTHHFRHLPVVDARGKLVGILSIRNLLESRIDDLSQQLDSLETYLTADGPGG